MNARIFWNPAESKVEDVKVIEREEHMTRVERKNGSKVWVPNRLVHI